MSDIGAVSHGIALTCEITAASFAFGALGGIPLFLVQRSPFWPVQALSRTVVEVLRAIPPVVWLFVVYFGIGSSLLQLTPVPAAIIGLSVITAAYMSEIYRGAVSAVDRGQWDASKSLALSLRTTWLSVIAPQLVRICVPAATTWGIGLLKDSSIASTIGAAEITYYAKNQVNQTGSAITPFLWAGLLYIVLTIPLAGLSRFADRKLRARVAR